MRLLSPAARIVAVISFVVAVIGLPATIFRLSLAAALVGSLLVIQQVGPRWIARRLLVLLPFLVAAAIMPVVATGPRCAIGPLIISCAGGQAAALLVARILLCFGAVLVLIATTPAADIAEALAWLRVPAGLVVVINLMVRYLAVLTADMQRQSIARAARGDGRNMIGSWIAAASGIGWLFIRGYEQGERVHLAMVSRGFDGTMPFATQRPAAWQWFVAVLPAVVLVAVGELS